MRAALDYRASNTLAFTAVVGTVGLHHWPFPADNVFLAVVEAQKPWLFSGLAYLYATLWFSTPFLALSIASAGASIVALRFGERTTYAALPTYPKPAARGEPFLVLGERHHPTRPVRIAQPAWLTIPRRGLHTGVMILGAVGTGKTSGCMYPYVDQLLAWKADSKDEKIGGLILEVKGDFCAQVSRILQTHGRAEDYVEVGLDSPYCYNPLHNELEPYALAYSVATLLNNLYGRGKEPFWQQAYTELLKFVILLRKVLDQYTTLAEVYHYAIDEGRIERDIKRGEEMFTAETPTIRISQEDYEITLAKSAWPHWRPLGEAAFTHPHQPELLTYLQQQGVPHEVDQPIRGAEWEDRRLQLDAVKRWYYSNWVRLEPRLRSSIVEGIVVFLSLFDDNPALARAFCP